MNLPYISGNLIFWADPSEKFVYKKSNLITSVLNRVSGEPSLLGDGDKPLWTNNGINGKPSFVFNGSLTVSQALRFNLPDQVATVSADPIVMTAAVQRIDETVNGIVLYMGDKSSAVSGHGILLEYYSKQVFTERYDELNTVGTVGPDTDSNNLPNIYTSIFDGSNLILRINGVEKSRTAHTPNNGIFLGNQISLGEYTIPLVNTYGVGGIAFPYKGYIGQSIVYNCKRGNIDLTPEKYLLDYYGIR